MFPINSTQSSVQFPGVPNKQPSSEKKGNSNHEIFKNAIAGTASTKNLSEHSITIHTKPETDPSEAIPEDNCSEITAKKKKKKKKTPSAQQKQVAALIGQAAFGLTPMPPAPSIEKKSIYSDPCFSSFKEGEKKILNEMLADHIFFDSSNLLEVFMGDLYRLSQDLTNILQEVRNHYLYNNRQWPSTIKSEIIDKIHNGTNEILGLKSGELLLGIFSFEMLLLNEKIENEDFSPTLSLGRIVKRLLKEGCDLIKNYFNTHIEQPFLNKGKEFPTIVKQYTECLNSYEEKLRLFYRCLLTKNMKKICLHTKTNSWIEAAQTSISNQEKLSQKYLQLSAFMKHTFEFSKQLKEFPEIKDSAIQYLDSITQIVSGKINKISLKSFLHTYKQYALRTTEKIIFLELLRGDWGTSQKYNFLANDSLENPKPTNELLPEPIKEVLTGYEMQYYSLLTLDKWMSDLHEAICFGFYEKFNELGVNSPQSHLERLLAMMHIARNDLEEVNKVKANENLSGLSEIQETIQKLTPEIEREFHRFNNLKEWIKSDESLLVLSKLKEELQQKPFQLTKCFLQFPKDMKKTISGGQVNALITQMKQAIFDIVKKAKSNSLKEKIQEILIDETAELCVYLMIMAEANNLFEEDHSKGFTQILPNEIVSLLDLTDLEEIFAESSVSNSDNEFSVTPQSGDSFRPLEELADESPKSNEPEILEKPKKKETVSSTTSPQPKITKAPKEIEMPTKQDFKDATNKRVFLRLLTKLGFTPSTHGKHPGYEKNGYRIPVPHSVEAEGTRVSIYEQATRAGHLLESKR